MDEQALAERQTLNTPPPRAANQLERDEAAKHCGYPQAHENDAERAARAALLIQRALAEINRKNAGAARPEFVTRIGLESGPAVLDETGEILL